MKPHLAPSRQAQAPLAFAHRGGAKEAPENTWAAFEHAVALGYRWVETDAHATADGVAVLSHDPDLRRVAGVDMVLQTTRWEVLATQHLADGRPPPRLEEVLSSWPETNWNIDLKSTACIGPVVAALERCHAQARVILGSFSGARTARARAMLGGTVRTSAGRNEIALFALASRAGANWGLDRTPSAALQVPLYHGRKKLVDARFVELAHSAGKAVHVWTIDDTGDMDYLLNLGVEGIMTDRPSLLKQVLSERDEWAP